MRELIVVFGLLAFFFYAYGIYAIEQVYNWLYFVYLALFGISFYSLVYSITSLRLDVADAVSLPPIIRRSAVGFSLFVAILFSLIWIRGLVELVEAKQRVEFAFQSTSLIYRL